MFSWRGWRSTSRCSSGGMTGRATVFSLEPQAAGLSTWFITSCSEAGSKAELEFQSNQASSSARDNVTVPMGELEGGLEYSKALGRTRLFFRGGVVNHTYFDGGSVDEELAAAQLEVEPGTRWHYANRDTLALVRAIRHVIGNDNDYSTTDGRQEGDLLDLLIFDHRLDERGIQLVPFGGLVGHLHDLVASSAARDLDVAGLLARGTQPTFARAS